MEIKERFANPPKESFPYILWRLEEDSFPQELSSFFAFLKNLCAGLIIQASPKQKEEVKRVCLTAKKEDIPIYLVLPPLFPFTSILQASRISVGQGGMLEFPIQGKPLWVGAISTQSFAQSNIINLEPFIQEGILRWSAPSGNWDILVISTSPLERRENSAEIANFWLEELADFIPPLSGFYIPSIEFHPFPWRDDLPEEFQRRRGYPFPPSFPSLALDLDEKSAKFRYDFRRTVWEIWKENIEGILYILQRKGLSFLASPDLREHCWGEIFLLAPHLSSAVLQPTGNPFVDEVASTLLSSFPSLLLLEIKWASPPEEIKNQIDRFSSFGIKGSIFSFPFLPIDNPPWSEPLLPPIASYQARLTSLLSHFPPNQKMAMLLPRLSLWSHQRLGEDDQYFQAIERDIFYLCELLHKIHYQFVFVDEDDLPNLSQLQTLVLPSISTLRPRTLRWLEKFYEGGGNILALGMLPFRSEEGVDRNLQNDVRSLFKVNIEDINNLYILSSTMGLESGVTYAIGKIHPISQGKIYAYQPAIIPDRREALRQTRQILRNCSPPDLDSLQEDILCHPRGDRLFIIFNRGEKATKVNAMLPLQGIPYRLEPRTGESRKLVVYSLMEDGRIIIPQELPPRSLSIILVEEGRELHIDQANFPITELRVGEDRIEVIGWQTTREAPFVVIEYEEERKFKEVTPSPPLPPIPLPIEWEIKPEHPNVLPLKKWRFQRKTSWLSRLAPPKRPQENWPLLPRDYTPRGETWYQTAFSLREVVEEITLYANCPLEDAFLNGRRLKGKGEIPLKGFLTTGLNHLTLLINHNKYPFMPFILLRGDFSLYFLEGEWTIGRRKPTLQVGSWTEQGFPFYVGTIVYQTRFMVPSLYLGKKATLSLGQIKEMVEVEVNGHKAGFLFSPPWELDIGEFLKEGENELVLRISNCPPPSPSEEPHPSGMLTPSQILIFSEVRFCFPLE